MRFITLIMISGCGLGAQSGGIPFIDQPFCFNKVTMIGRSPDGHHYEYSCPGGCKGSIDGIQCDISGQKPGEYCWAGFEGKSACSNQSTRMTCLSQNLIKDSGFTWAPKATGIGECKDSSIIFGDQ